MLDEWEKDVIDQKLDLIRVYLVKTKEGDIVLSAALNLVRMETELIWRELRSGDALPW